MRLIRGHIWRVSWIPQRYFRNHSHWMILFLRRVTISAPMWQGLRWKRMTTASESEVSPPCLTPTAWGTTHSILRCRIYSKLFFYSFNMDRACALGQPLDPLSLCFLRVRAAWASVQPVSVPSIPICFMHVFLPMFCPFHLNSFRDVRSLPLLRPFWLSFYASCCARTQYDVFLFLIPSCPVYMCFTKWCLALDILALVPLPWPRQNPVPVSSHRFYIISLWRRAVTDAWMLKALSRLHLVLFSLICLGFSIRMIEWRIIESQPCKLCCTNYSIYILVMADLCSILQSTTHWYANRYTQLRAWIKLDSSPHGTQ